MTANREWLLEVAHEVDSCRDDGEGWHLICSCGWEAWGFATEDKVYDLHAAHALDPQSDRPVTVLA